MADITNKQLLEILREDFATKDDFAELRKEQLHQSVLLNKIEQKLDGVSQVVETIADNYATHDDIAELDHKLDNELASNKSWRKALARAAAQ